MANEVLHKTTTQLLVGSNTAALDSTSVPTSVGTLAPSQHLSYPLLDFVLTFNPGSSFAAGSHVQLLARPLGIDGTNDTPAPDASYVQKLVGIFPTPYTSASTTTIYSIKCYGVPSDAEHSVEYYLYNKSNGSLAGNWALRVTPRTIVPGA